MLGRIIELAPADDAASAADRIEWAQADRLVLVLPAACKWNEVEFERLLRAGRHLDVEVAVATRQTAMRRTAHEVGLPSFASADEAVRRRWIPNPAVEALQRHGPPRRFRPSSLRQFFARRSVLHLVFGGVVALAALAVVVAAALVFVPTATISLSASSQPVQSIVAVTIDPTASEVNIEKRIVPAQRIDVVVEGRVGVDTTGKRELPKFRASGKVRFFNDLNTAYRVPANTVVRTSGSSQPARFATLQDVEVPPGGRVEADIEAVEEGPQGNVAANTINQVEGVASLAVRAVNPVETQGGGNTVVSAVTQADIERAKQQLREQLFAQAVEQMKTQPEITDGGLYVVPATLFIAEVQDETADRFVTEQADAVNVSTRIQVAALAVSPTDMNTIARNALEAKTPQGFSLLSARVIQGDAAEEGGSRSVTYFMSARGLAGAEIDENAVKKLIAGKTRAEAQSLLLQEFAINSTPRLTLQPSWWVQYVGRMPWITLRMNTTVRRE